MKKLNYLLVFVILLLPLALADTFESPGASTFGVPGAWSNITGNTGVYLGVVINLNTTVNLSYVTIYDGGTGAQPTTLYIHNITNSTNANLLASSSLSYSGHYGNATFSKRLYAGDKYSFSVGSGGSSYTSRENRTLTTKYPKSLVSGIGSWWNDSYINNNTGYYEPYSYYWRDIFGFGTSSTLTPPASGSFGVCNATLTYYILNFTFKDESTLNPINATFTGYFNWTADGGVNNNSFSYTNTTEGKMVTLCASDTESRDVTYSVSSSSTSYPIRTFSEKTNLPGSPMTNKTLYLLDSSTGIYTTFAVINAAEQPLEGVLVNISRSIESNNVVLGAGYTGADGGITFWQNPNYAHTTDFLLSPYPLYSVTQAFTQSSYTITLGGTGNTNITDYQKGVNYSINPLNSYLLNGTTYTFNFSITSTYYNLQVFGFNLTTSNGILIGSNSSTGATGGVVSLSKNTASNTSFILNYYWTINNTNTSASRNWLIINTDDTGYSIANLLSNFNTYRASGLFGIDDFGVGILSFILILLITGIIKSRYSIADEAVIVGIIFSLVALFDISFGLIPNPIGAVPHFPTIFMGIIFLGFMFKEVYQ